MLLHCFLFSFVPQLWVDSFLGSLGNGCHQLVEPPSCNVAKIRNATLDDAHEIAQIIVDAFGPAPAWRYAYQFKDQYADYHLECLRNRTMKNLQTKKDGVEFVAHIIDLPVETSTGVETFKPVAVAFWQLIKQGSHLATLANYDCQDHLDANLTRLNDIMHQLGSAVDKYTHNPDHDQLYLGLLATLPDWQGQGLGETHLYWGQKYARQQAVNITLLSTPEGYPVYKGVGFEGVENLTVTKIDGDGQFWYEAMRWQP